MGNHTGLYAACLMAALLLVGCDDAKLCQNCNEGVDHQCPSSPVLAASAGNGEVTLKWEPADSQGTAVKAWQYRQAVQGESWSATRSTGPAATAYVVSGLTNGLAYTFQVRSQLDAAEFGCWSAAVSVVPRRIDDVMERMEKHQEAIAKHMSEVVARMAARQELLQKLGEQGIVTLGEVAASTSEIAKHSAGIRDGVVQVAGNVDAAGQEVAAATMAVVQQAEDIRNEVGELVSSVDAAGQKVADGLADIVAQLGKACDGCEMLPANCHSLGRVFFDHDSHRIGDNKRNEERNEEAFNKIIAGLQVRKGGLFLTEGYASTVGYARHNLHLSDMRAACVSRCLHDRLASLWLEDGNFEFREIARGEVSGANEENQRVDVTFCPGYSPAGPNAEKRPPVWPTDCACPNGPF